MHSIEVTVVHLEVGSWDRMSGASWLFLVFSQISLEHGEQIEGRGSFHGVYWVLWKWYLVMYFISNKRVSCCTLQIKICCCKSLVLVTALSAKHFLVAPVLSIMFCDCTGENIFCNLKLNFISCFCCHCSRQCSCGISYTEWKLKRWFNSCWEIQTISVVCYCRWDNAIHLQPAAFRKILISDMLHIGV